MFLHLLVYQNQVHVLSHEHLMTFLHVCIVFCSNILWTLVDGLMGLIERIIRGTGSEAQIKKTAFVEFKSGKPIHFLQSPTRNPNITNHIQYHSDLYAANLG